MLVRDPSAANSISSFFSSAAVKFVVPVLNRLVPKTAPTVAPEAGKELNTLPLPDISED